MKPPVFNLPLGERPRLRAIGRAVHGSPPVARYRLKGLWCLHLYTYHAHLTVGGRRCDIHPASLSVLPPDTDLVYYYPGLCQHLYAHLELRSSRPVRPVPAMQDTGPDYARLSELFTEAVGFFATQQSLRAEIRVWDLLWRAADARGAEEKSRMHPAVEEVARQIELRLHEPLLVESLAREVGLSHNHLIRLFHAGFGQTVKGYLTARRMEKARHLLRSSSLSIKHIAHDVGLGDLQAFNKAVRRHFGRAPRELRR
jgi:AraC-like DNA-binding protein